MKFPGVILLLCCISITLSNAQTKKSTPTSQANNQTLFTVNGKVVTTDEFMYLYRKNHQHESEDYTKEKIDEYLNLFINFKLKVEEARRRGMDTTAAFNKEFNQYKDELRKPYLPDTKMTDSLVHLTYNRMKEEVHAAHILVNIKPQPTDVDTLKAYEKIMNIRKRILAGEDFGKVASEESEDPSAKMNQGDLGYFTAMQMVFPFETAAYTTKPGEVSMPVRTKFGYHLVKVLDRRPARGEVEVSHIMIRTGEDKKTDEAKNKIFDIHDKLRAGVPWEEACKESSEDPGSKDNGGKLRPFGVGAMSNVPAFERVAFELSKPGEISDPFQTQYGWHIVRLERKIPLQSYDEVASTLKTKVNRDERTQISKHLSEERLRKQYGLKENKNTRETLLALLDSSLQKGQWKPNVEDLNKQVLFSLKEREYRVQDFLAYAQKNQRANAMSPENYFNELYNNFVNASIITLLEQDIVHKNPEYAYLLNEYYEGILLFEIMEKEVWNKASEDSVGQQKYYDSHKANYGAGERVRATFYSHAQKDLLTDLQAIVEAGDEKKIQEYVAKNRIKVESGFYKKDDKAILKSMPWQKGIYTAENNGMYYLAWLKELLPPGTMSFEEARPAIVSDYQSFLEKNWVSELKKKHRVKVNGKGKKYVFEQLQKK